VSHRRIILLAALLAFLTYLPSLAGGFLYDDTHVVLGNRGIRDLGAIATVLRAEPSRPLLGLTWALNYAASGLRPWPYHLVNVLIHTGNAALLASLLLWMCRRSARPEHVALVAACLFAVTPMAAETVAYVASRSTALASLFVLAALRLAVGVLEGPAPWRFAAAVVLFLLGLATKEEAASMPLYLLLLDRFFVRAPLRRALRVHVPLFALPIVGLLARAAATGAWLPAPALDRGRYLATQLAVFPQYLLRALVPVDPAFYRFHPVASWPPQAWALAGWIATAALATVAIASRRRFSQWSFAIAWLAAGLLPSSSILPLKEIVVDHRAYLGSAGALFALATLLWRPGRAWLAGGVITLCAVLALRYEWVLADPMRAWGDAVARAPGSAEAHLALGEAYAARGRPEAEAELSAAVNLNSERPEGWTNLGAYYASQRRWDSAAVAMREAVRTSPRDPRLHDNLGLILEMLGREEEAVAQFEAAVAAEPPLAAPRINLAAILLRRGDRPRARALLAEAQDLELDPQDDDALVALQQQLGPP
jgi:Tfp pilus assembly protein PilF